jgi:energy-coupling factor transporter ATP-binding protein EcfA2
MNDNKSNGEKNTKNSIIEIDNLTYKYPDGTPALNGITLSIGAGERVALLGQNGAGKSTLILHLNGILTGDGSIKIAGMQPSKQNLRAIRSQVGLVFQNPDDQLFLTTVFDDVAFGPINQGLNKDEVVGRVQEALDLVDMLWAVNKSAHHLSFGQKKRVALATIISMRSRIMVLDEPTSNLDPVSRKRLEALLLKIDRAMLIATHNLDFAWRICERSIIVSKGKVVADGPTKELLRDKELLEANGLELPTSAMLEKVCK